MELYRSRLFSEAGREGRRRQRVFSGLQRPLALARGIGLRALHLLLRIREGVSGANQFDSFNQYLNLCNQHLIPVREELTVQKGKQMGKQSPYNQLSGVKESGTGCRWGYTGKG